MRLIPSTDGTGVDASAASAPQRAEDKKESDADEYVDE
jgi:hypothetical protein